MFDLEWATDVIARLRHSRTHIQYVSRNIDVLVLVHWRMHELSEIAAQHQQHNVDGDNDNSIRFKKVKKERNTSEARL